MNVLDVNFVHVLDVNLYWGFDFDACFIGGSSVGYLICIGHECVEYLLLMCIGYKVWDMKCVGYLLIYVLWIFVCVCKNFKKMLTFKVGSFSTDVKI